MLEAFRINENGAKHLDYVTCHVGTHRNVFGRKYDWAWRSPKIPQKQPKLKVIYTLSDFLTARVPDSTGCLLRTWEVIAKESFGLE